MATPALLAGAGGIDSRVGGVRLGVQTYSFRELPRDAGRRRRRGRSSRR